MIASSGPNLQIKTTPTIECDLYEINMEWKLEAFEVDCSDVDSELLNKLAFRLKILSRHTWVANEGVLLREVVDEDPNQMLKELWNKYSEDFASVQSFTKASNWEVSPGDIARFTAKQFERYQPSLETMKIQGFEIKRVWNAQGIVINEKPFIALSIKSETRSRESIDQHGFSQEELIGLRVRNRFGKGSGEICSIVGTLDNHRTRLLGVSKTDAQKKILRESPDDSLVVTVLHSSRKKLDYSVKGLCASPRNEDLHLFGINSRKVLNFQKMRSDKRRGIITKALSNPRIKRIVGQPINSTNSTFTRTTQDWGYNGNIKLGNGVIVQFNTRTIFGYLRQHGFYKVERHFEKSPIVIGVYNSIGNNPKIEYFLNDLKMHFSKFGFDCEYSNIEEPSGTNYTSMEKSVDRLLLDKPHIILGLIPDKNGSRNAINNQWLQAKQFIIEKGTMNQMVNESSVNFPQYKFENIALQMLSKIGNVPWVLEKELDYCDKIMGGDISRKKKSKSRGTMNHMGVPRWYKSNGDFFKYRIIDAQLEGERIPMEVIRKLTPSGDCEGEDILFHLDGKRPSDEIDDFLERGNELKGKLIVVEVIKSPPYRIYSSHGEQVYSPKKGDGIKHSDTEAVVVSTLPAHDSGTPQPLLIRCTNNISIENAVHSVLALSDLHHGSRLQSKLPITTHSAHDISKLMLYGIKPPNEEGFTPWWL